MPRNLGNRRRRRSAERETRRPAFVRTQPREDELTLFHHPLSDLPREDVAAFLSELAQNGQESFPRNLKKLQESLRHFNGEHVLMSLSYFCLSGFVEVGGTVHQSSSPINQSHLEFLQALYLSSDATTVVDEPAPPEAVQNIADHLVELATAFTNRRLKDLLAASTDLERHQMIIREQLRGATQVVRNWGYVDDVFQIMRAWAAPLDAVATGVLRFSFTELLDVAQEVLACHQHATQRFFEKMQRVAMSRSKRSLAKRFAEEFLNPSWGPDEMNRLLERFPQFSRRSLWEFLGLYSTQFLDQVFRFSANDIARRLRRRGLRFDPRVVLESISIRPGSLSGRTIEHFFLDNPVWANPLMSMGAEAYCAPLSQVLLHGIWDTVRQLAKRAPQLEVAVQKRRAVYLEEAVAEQFRSAFPEAQIVTSSLFGPALKFENDLLVVVGEFALVIEAKSGAPRSSGLRGGMDSFRATVKDLITEPLIQSQRFADWIAGRRETLRLPRRDGQVNEVDLSAVRYVLRLGVILEDMASMHAVTSQLQQAQLIPGDVPLAPIITLADLRVLFDILPTPAEKLHYLWRRQALESSIGLLTDELDLLGLYLQSGFNLGDLEAKQARLALTGMSFAIDSYYERRRIGFRPRKPRLLLSRWWAAILDRLSRQRPPRWLELSVKLLHVSPMDQRRTQRRLRRLTNRIARSAPFSSIASNAELLVTGSPQRRDAFVFLAYRAAELLTRNEWMRNAASQALGKREIRSVVVFAICVDWSDWPYSSLAVYSVEPETSYLSDSSAQSYNNGL